MRLSFSLISLLGLLPALTAPAAPELPANVAITAHTRAELIAENSSLAPGDNNWVALKLSPQPGWHTYWRNPGEAGLPTELRWRLPPGVRAGDIHWPYPHRLATGKIISYGYDAPTLHLVRLHVDPNRAAGPVTVVAEARWLVCETICIPEQATLSLTLPLGAGPPRADPDHASEFARARARLPQPLPAGATAAFAVDRGELRLGLHGFLPPAPTRVDFFPEDGKLINDEAAQRFVADSDGLRLAVATLAHPQLPQRLRGVLEVHTADGRLHAYAIDAAAGTVAPLPARPAPSAAGVGPSVWLALGLALLGGLLLNLMPCVFPVLAIKALTLVRAQGGAARAHAIAYSLGVIAAMMTLAGVLLGLRAGGLAVGWGFQLQSPPVVAALALLMFALGLWMSGVVEFGSGLMGLGQRLTERGGFSGSFFTGVLAVVVASPCTAPFMASALGYALLAPAPAALGVFLALGVGLALPFALIAAFPHLAGWLPRPGAWMETFKQLLAFPLYLTAAWLLWVLTRQSGADALALALLAMIALAFGLWVRGRWPQRRPSALVLALSVTVAAALLASPTLRPPPAPATAPQSAEDRADPSRPQAYSAGRLARLRDAGRTVFVDFTADWCITCKVNERVALRDPEVLESFRRHRVAWLVADWTRGDPQITAALARFGRPGVPLYLVYHGRGPAQVLPQVLTPAIVVDAIASGRGDD